ncbi:unnamed protein product [Cunninghamella blakesleeana]
MRLQTDSTTSKINGQKPITNNSSTTEAATTTESATIKKTTSKLSFLSSIANSKSNSTNANQPASDNESSSPSAPVTKAPLSDNEFKSTSEALIRKLLQLSSPRLDAKIVSVLLLDGMMEIFMSHIVRLKDDTPLNTHDFQQLLLDAKHERNHEDIDSLKRSYHAMEILSGSSANHFWIQDAKFNVIISKLFDIFLPTSDGNLNHFAKILQHFIRRHPCDTLDYIFLQDEKATLFYDYLLPYITDGAVMDSIISLLFVRDINPETKSKREQCHTKLSELCIIQWLVKSIQLKNDASFADTAGELMIRIIEEASQVDNGHLLFNIFESSEDEGSKLIDSLVELVVNQKRTQNRKLVIKILRLLVKSGFLQPRASTLSQPMHGPLHQISIKCQSLLSKHIPKLCSVIADDRHAVSSKMLPLNVSDLELLDIIYTTLPNITDKAKTIDEIPTAFWRIIVNSFFEKTSSAIYHTLFYRIFCLVINLHYDPLVQVLIRRQKLITRFIDVYEDKSQKVDMRGHILLMLNYLRLITDAEPNGLLHRIISDHPRYQQFLPKLREETLAQTTFKYNWKLNSCPRPPIHLGPSPPIRAPPYSTYTPTLQLTDGDNDDASGIDLGSDYAYCMGFDQAARIDDGYETPMGNLSRRPSVHSISSCESQSSTDSNNGNGYPLTDMVFFESLTAEDVTTLMQSSTAFST